MRREYGVDYLGNKALGNDGLHLTTSAAKDLIKEIEEDSA